MCGIVGYVGSREAAAATRAIESGWVAPLGPEVDAFEAEVAAYAGTSHAVAPVSGVPLVRSKTTSKYCVVCALPSTNESINNNKTHVRFIDYSRVRKYKYKPVRLTVMPIPVSASPRVNACTGK